MAFEITVLPSRHRYACEADETLLDAALRHGVSLPHGCRDGGCGACRARVVSGEVEQSGARSGVLSDVERDAGVTLLCCTTAHSDVVIAASEIQGAQLPPAKTLPARVEKLTRAAPDVMLLELKLPGNERLQFRAGQYIDILLKDGRRRAFSLANAPHDDARLQLHVRHVPGGVFTDHVFAGMKEREVLRFNGPHGSFFVREESDKSDKPLLLIAGGTGMAPIKAIVDHLVAERCTRPIAVYWGGRTRADLYLPEIGERWSAAGVRFVPVLSAALPEDRWEGRQGLVHEAAMSDFSDLSGYQVYACGAPAMVAAARRDFVGLCGLPDGEFFADAFTSAADAPQPDRLTLAG